MNILLIGGSCSLMDSVILKFRKEGHRVFILTGDQYRRNRYKKVFERYDFPYDSEHLSDILESINPDATILMGAFDTNYHWQDEGRETVRFTSHLVNILVAYSGRKKGKVIFLSSDEVYSGNYINDIEEAERMSGHGLRAECLMQAEEICENFRENRGLDLMILRLDHLYSIPKEKKDVTNLCARMCLECMRQNSVRADAEHTFSLLYENDAVEYLYQAVRKLEHEYDLYHLSSNDVISEVDLAVMIQECMKSETHIVVSSNHGGRCVLSGNRFEREYGVHAFADLRKNIEKMVSCMQKHRDVFLNEDEPVLPWWKRVWNKWKWLLHVMIPFVENLICFIPFFVLNRWVDGSEYFANLDPFLLYVLLFAIIYGQQQSTFSAICSVMGYFYQQTDTRSSFEVLLDYNTYVWIAQLFIVGLVVGYMRDQIRTMRMESEEMEEHLSRQITDIRGINESNVRVKGVIEQQLIDHKDSIGKIYSITQTLDQYMPDEVLFYAVDMLTKLMQTKDVALYNVVNGDYARIFSASSAKARSLGNSLRYREMTEVYEDLREERVYINKTMTPSYPLMARGIYSDGSLQMIIMIWGIGWEKMTLGQANFLTIVSYLIQNALLRAQRYMQSLEEKRYSGEDSKILKQEAFEPLVQAYLEAERRELAECILLQVCVGPEQYAEIDGTMSRRLRDSDYLGLLSDGNLYVLLANTTRESAVFVQDRFTEYGYRTEVVEKVTVCHKE